MTRGLIILLLIIVVGVIVYLFSRRLAEDASTLDFESAVEYVISVDDFTPPGEFVIFEMGDELTYIQFSINTQGLQCFWVKGLPTIDLLEPKLLSYLSEWGFQRVEPGTDDVSGFLNVIEPMQYAEIEGDGFYIQIGRDYETVKSFIEGAFTNIHGRFDPDELEITIAHHHP